MTNVTASVLKAYTIGLAVGLFCGLIVAINYGWEPWRSWPNSVGERSS